MNIKKSSKVRFREILVKIPIIGKIVGYPYMGRTILENGTFGYENGYGVKIFNYRESIIVIGILKSSPGIRAYQKIFIAKYNMSGDKIWDSIFLNSFEDSYELKATEIDNEGNVYIAGKRSRETFFACYKQNGESVIYTNHSYCFDDDIELYKMVSDSERVFLLAKEKSGEQRIRIYIFEWDSDGERLENVPNRNVYSQGIPFDLLIIDNDLYMTYSESEDSFASNEIIIKKMDRFGNPVEEIEFMNRDNSQYKYAKMYFRRDKLCVAYIQHLYREENPKINFYFKELGSENGVNISQFAVDEGENGWEMIERILDSCNTVLPNDLYFLATVDGEHSLFFRMKKTHVLNYSPVILTSDRVEYFGFDMTFGPRRFLGFFTFPTLVFFTGKENNRPFLEVRKLSDIL